MNQVKDESRECYGKYTKISAKTGKQYSSWYFLGWYTPQGTLVKSTRDFDFYEEQSGDICKYRKLNQ